MQYPLGQRLRELPGPVMLTGHTGFKGTWMTFLLENLGVPVIGYSLPPDNDSLFHRSNRTGTIPEVFADIRDYDYLENFIDKHKPSTIVHMAAQPLVLKSYEMPRDTFEVNVMGTVSILDIAFKKDYVKGIIVVTTDKVYRNDETSRSFVENDPLEGKDPYSASKVGTEAAVAAWQQIAKTSGGPSLISVRAGNVIGGGDFAENRIIPDIIRGVMNGQSVEIRNPASTRPWQHVLDPLRGYLLALEKSLTDSDVLNLNFGPSQENYTVKEVARVAKSFFPNLQIILNESNLIRNKESQTLSLDSKLSLEYLNWNPFIHQEEAINMTFKWWRDAIDKRSSIQELCAEETRNYLKIETV